MVLTLGVGGQTPFPSAALETLFQIYFPLSQSNGAPSASSLLFVVTFLSKCFMPQSRATSLSRVGGRRETCDILWYVITHGHLWDQDAFNWEEANLGESDRCDLNPVPMKKPHALRGAEQKRGGKTPSPPVNSLFPLGVLRASVVL